MFFINRSSYEFSASLKTQQQVTVDKCVPRRAKTNRKVFIQQESVVSVCANAQHSKDWENKKQVSSVISSRRQTFASDRDLRMDMSEETGGRVARRGRSHTSQRMLLPWFITVQLLHCHSERTSTNTVQFKSNSFQTLTYYAEYLCKNKCFLHNKLKFSAFNKFKALNFNSRAQGVWKLNLSL